MRKGARGILVVHSDLSERVARLVVGELMGKGQPVTRRNVRYGYFSDMYALVLLIGVKDDMTGANMMSYDYVAYSDYRRESDGSLSREEYHAMYAGRIASKIVESIEHV